MTMDEPSPRDALSRMTSAFQVSQAIYVDATPRDRRPVRGWAKERR